MKIHSQIDVITNSSGTSFVSISLETHSRSFDKATEFLKKIFKNGDCIEDFEISVMPSDVFIKSKKTGEVFSLDNVLQSIFDLEGEYD